MAHKKKAIELTPPKRILGWHFLEADMRSTSGDEPAWSEGEERTISDSSKVALCEFGYHWSPTPLDALGYATGAVLCRVEVSEPTESDGNKHDYNRKSVSVSRKLLAFADVTSVLREFAVDCAERVLPLFEKEYPDDKRVRHCIEQTRAYLRGEIDIEELRKARSAHAADAAAYAADAAAIAADAAAIAADAAATAAAADAAAYAAAAAAYAAAYAAAAAAYAAATAAHAAAYAADAAAYAAAYAAYAAHAAAYAAAAAAGHAAAYAAAYAAAKAAEKQWQAAHLEELLRAAHPHLFAF